MLKKRGLLPGNSPPSPVPQPSSSEESAKETPHEPSHLWESYGSDRSNDTKTGCYRSFLKFVLGYILGKIDVGVVIVYDMPEIKSHHGKRFSVTQKELEDLKTIIPAPIFLIGIHP